MKSAQFLSSGRRGALCRATTATVALLAFAPGCTTVQPLDQPMMLRAPYATGQLWAVAPFANESGSLVPQTDHIADLLAEQIQQAEGLDVVPVNRVIAAMRQLEMDSIQSPHEAAMLLRTLGVDGLIVGTITAYDAYPPPKLGAAIQLFRREVHASYSDLDPHALVRAPTDQSPVTVVPRPAPSAQAAGVYDASNHQTLAWLDEYARGRTEPDSAYGAHAYLVSMELFTEFVSYRLLHDLLAFEQSGGQPQDMQEPPR